MIKGAPSWLEPRAESSREESGEDIIEAASKDVGGADESCVLDDGRPISMLDIPSLSVAVSRAFCKLDDLNALASVVTRGFLAGAGALVARRGSLSSPVMGLILDLGPFVGDGRGGCLKFFDEL